MKGKKKQNLPTKICGMQQTFHLCKKMGKGLG
jgi:hypothetical protein